MNRTAIDWCDYTWNPIKGLCPVKCPYCYARKMYLRNNWNPKIRLDEKELYEVRKRRKAVRIFLNSTIEMYHPDIPSEFVGRIVGLTRQLPQHTFISLTKSPEWMRRYNIPDSWWIGVSLDNLSQYSTQPNLYNLARWERLHSLFPQESGVKFISFEPLLSFNAYIVKRIFSDGQAPGWVIIGAQTKPYLPPKRDWVERIIEKARDRSVPVFLKENLSQAYPGLPELREFPKEEKSGTLDLH